MKYLYLILLTLTISYSSFGQLRLGDFNTEILLPDTVAEDQGVNGKVVFTNPTAEALELINQDRMIVISRVKLDSSVFDPPDMYLLFERSHGRRTILPQQKDTLRFFMGNNYGNSTEDLRLKMVYFDQFKATDSLFTQRVVIERLLHNRCHSELLKFKETYEGNDPKVIAAAFVPFLKTTARCRSVKKYFKLTWNSLLFYFEEKDLPLGDELLAVGEAKGILSNVEASGYRVDLAYRLSKMNWQKAESYVKKYFPARHEQILAGFSE